MVRAYDLPTLALRMLIVTNLNLGYFCGELQALAAAAPITSRFDWVLCFSGPDAMPTPYGMSCLSQHVARWHEAQPPGSHLATALRGRALASPAPAPAFLYDWFPAPRHHFRVSMDVFLYFPAALHARSAARHIRLHPPADRNRSGGDPPRAQPHRAPHLRSPHAHDDARLKLVLGWPPPNSVVWHCHNESARGVWLGTEGDGAGSTLPFSRPHRTGAIATAFAMGDDCHLAVGRRSDSFG